MLKPRIILTLLLFVIMVQVMPQNTKPKVALVLSGGGAKGLGHIGVLKVLEEVGIKPDIIAGTSMGAIVGGLYSIGYSAEELDSIVVNADWDALLSNYIPLKDVIMEEKSEYGKYLIEFPVIDRKIYLPSGVIEGQKLSQLFSELCWRAVGIEHFDHFPIQFRCVASDIINGEIVVFEKGDLPEAMRASMAIPTVFTPVIIDSNKLCVDGGVMRNFPVPEAIGLGADIVIGVYVGFREDVSISDLSSFADILTRTSAFYGINDYKEQIVKVDVLIEPDMKNFSAGNFNNAKKIVEIGEKAGRAKINELKKLSGMIDSFAKPVQKLLPDPDIVFVKDIVIENNKVLSNEFVLKRSGIVPGSWVSKKDMETALDRIYGTIYVDKVTYRFVYEKGGYVLKFVLKESPPAHIKVALRYDSDFGSGLKLNFTTRKLPVPNSKFIASGYLSDIPRLSLNYYQYLGPNLGLFVRAGFNYEKNKVPMYRESRKIGEFDHRFLESFIDANYAYTRNFNIGIKGAYEYAEIFPGDALKAFVPGMDFNMYGYGNFTVAAHYEIDFRNNVYFPTWGNYLSFKYKKGFNPVVEVQQDETLIIDTGYFNTDLDEYYMLQLHYDHHQRVGNKIIMRNGIVMGLTSRSTVISELYFAGGISPSFRYNSIPLVGFSLMEKNFQKFLKLDLGLDYRLTKKLYIASVFNVLKNEKHTESLLLDIYKYEKADTYMGYALGLKYNSFLGPCHLMVGDNNKDASLRWYFSAGHQF